jgi:hypothetical protein
MGPKGFQGDGDSEFLVITKVYETEPPDLEIPNLIAIGNFVTDFH